MHKTPETAAAYQRRGRQLWNRAATECKCASSTLLPGEFVDWLLSILPSLKPASRRQYLASTREWLGCLKCKPSNTKNVTQAFSEAIALLNNYSSRDFGCTKKK